MSRRTVSMLFALYAILLAGPNAAQTPAASDSKSQVVDYYFHRSVGIPDLAGHFRC